MNDITRQRRKLQKILRDIKALRQRKDLTSHEMISLAKRLGRERVKGSKEDTYRSPLLPHRRPLSIPRYSKPLREGTARNILDFLEDEAFALLALLDQEEAGCGERPKRLS